ncbi:putative Nudix hydrolase [Dictyobacter sp. S3.2.2.5]|uniref:Nudix hydrolase n=1 Tax=Dictyobacter halimunensis TaxID=3026934 RepID=A0ABQ6FJQ5_9CHLR|nr:putative Nudix hydrolase [Dictyobacter sp. S3.2.2.5]
METEQLAIFSETMERIGVRTRAEVHSQGYWHETFQCWFVQKQAGRRSILFQQRAAQKKDFPNQLDITAAGHLLAHESFRDGVREIQEELGLQLSIDDLVPAGIVPDPILLPGFQDREFCHLFFYLLPCPITSLVLQREEVAGIVCIELNDCERLLHHEISDLSAQVYLSDANHPCKVITRNVQRQDLCPHNDAYYDTVLKYAHRLLD